jgi:hypothetical protein
LGTAAKGMRFTNPKGIVERVWQDGFWVRGNDNEILRKRRSLLVRMVKEAPALAAVLFDKLLVPYNMQLVRRAMMKSGKAMMTFHSEQLLTEKSVFHAVHADQDDPKAVPVKCYVLALRGVLEDEELLQVRGSIAFCLTLSDFSNLTSLQVIAASVRVEAYMETKAIRGVEQHLWLTYGSTESMFRLAEYSCHVLLVYTFCWLVADTIIVHCPDHCGDDCDIVGWAGSDTFDGMCVYSVAAAAAQPAQSVCVTVLGVLAMLSSLRYLVEELVEVLYTLRSIYGIDRGMSITLHIHRTAVQANAPRIRCVYFPFQEISDMLLRALTKHLSSGWRVLPAIMHPLTLVVCVMSLAGQVAYFHLTSAALVQLAMIQVPYA